MFRDYPHRNDESDLFFKRHSKSPICQGFRLALPLTFC